MRAVWMFFLPLFIFMLEAGGNQDVGDFTSNDVYAMGAGGRWFRAGSSWFDAMGPGVSTGYPLGWIDAPR